MQVAIAINYKFGYKLNAGDKTSAEGKIPQSMESNLFTLNTVNYFFNGQARNLVWNSSLTCAQVVEHKTKTREA